MRFILVLLLIAFLAAFFGIDRFVDWYGGGQDLQISYLQIPLSSPELRIFLGIGAVILEFAIILFSMLDRIVDTIRETIKPLVRLIPLGAFLISSYQTFAPLLTNSVAMGDAGPAVRTSYLFDVVNEGSFSEGILLTLFTMLLFLVADRALRSESEEVKSLKAELAKYRRALR